MSRIVAIAVGFIGANSLARYAGGKRRGHDVSCPYDRICGEGAKSGFDLAGGGVPGDGAFAEIGFVGHVASQGSVVAEDGVFGDWLAVAHALEEFPKVRFFFVEGNAAIGESLGDGFFTGLGVVVFVPFFEIRFAQGAGKAVSVIAGGFVFAGLREIGDSGFRDFENSFGTLEAIDFRSIAAEIEAQINRGAAVIEERGVHVGHVAAIFEAQDVPESHGALGRLIPAKHVDHAADEMDEQVAGNAGAIFLPAAPAREIFRRRDRVPGSLGGAALPSVPVEIFRREIGRRRIFPSAVGIVAAKGAFHQSESAEDAGGEKLFGFRANDGADALRTDLHDAAGFLRGGNHGYAVGSGVRHGLLAVDVFAGAHGVNDNLAVPMIGDGGDEAVNFFVSEKLFVNARGGDFIAGDFLGENVAAVVEVAGGDAFDAWELDGFFEQAGTLHADANDAEAQAIARRDRLKRKRDMFGLKKNCRRSGERASGTGRAVEKLAAGKIFFHGALLERRIS